MSENLSEIRMECRRTGNQDPSDQSGASESGSHTVATSAASPTGRCQKYRVCSIAYSSSAQSAGTACIIFRASERGSADQLAAGSNARVFPKRCRSSAPDCDGTIENGY